MRALRLAARAAARGGRRTPDSRPEAQPCFCRRGEEEPSASTSGRPPQRAAERSGWPAATAAGCGRPVRASFSPGRAFCAAGGPGGDGGGGSPRDAPPPHAREARFFCPASGTVRPADDAALAGLDHFALFGLPRAFELDGVALEAEYKSLQRLLHPDKFTLRPAEEQAASTELAARVNAAYSTLRDPVRRGLYLLQLRGLWAGRAAAAGGEDGQRAGGEEEGRGGAEERTIRDPELLLEVRATFLHAGPRLVRPLHVLACSEISRSRRAH